ncbi:FixH family protein [Novosphingobium sp.]|uniref:FixH family protein n=1 Tax=Novosphingobium sp. TaxID=1874826 RepID=UPI00286DDE72|nr:FixH family protein [Novosphingobium sp.]
MSKASRHLLTNAPLKNVKHFTGRHMAAVMICFFGVIVAVNFTMATLASRSFGGQVVDNSYVASQKFNTWLDEAAKEKALGWTSKARRLDDNRIAIAFAGKKDVAISATARHPLGLEKSKDFTFERGADGTFVSRETLAPGRWTLRIEVAAGAERFRTEQDVR